MRSSCSSGPRRYWRRCPRSIRASCTRWVTLWAAATASRLRLSSMASIAGSAKSCVPTMPTPIFRALHGWRRYGKRSSAPRATPRNTILSENRWFSRYSGCSRKPRGNPPPDINPDNLALSHKGIRGGDAEEESIQEAQVEEGCQENCKEDSKESRKEIGCEESRKEI